MTEEEVPSFWALLGMVLIPLYVAAAIVAVIANPVGFLSMAVPVVLVALLALLAASGRIIPK